MYNEVYSKNISDGLAQLVVEVRQDAGSNLHAINIHAENFFREFLNLLFGWELSNANAVQANAAGVDLVYSGGKVVVQVSSTMTREKIQSSLEKTARNPAYSGAHFYFVAITDKRLTFKKEFTNYGLIFDPKKDILNTTELCRQIVNHKGRENKLAIEVQRELSELVDLYFSRQEQRQKLNLRRLGQNKATSLFEYHAGAVPLLGRQSELDSLKRFVTGEPETPFSWWAVTGPGAAGTTRLAYELQAWLLREAGWDVSVIPAEVLDRYEEDAPDLSEACPGRTLLIVDYVQKHTEALALLVERLSDPNLNRSAPLRLLLLEREILDEEGRIPWLEQIWGTDHHVHDCFYGKPQTPMKLSPLTAGEDGADPLEALIRAFADKLCEQEDPKGAGLHPLPAGKEAYLRNRLEEVDPGLLRPLFAMILADAYVRDPETERWSREKLLDHIADRELGMLAERIAPFHEPKSPLLPKAFRVLWMTATVLGAGDAPLAPERIPELLPQVWTTLSRAAAKHGEELERWGITPEEALLHQSGLLTGEGIQPLRPDLFGEYLVLYGLRRSGPSEGAAFLTAVLSEPFAALVFFGRVLDDYGALLLEDEALWEAVFPTEPQMELKKLTLYARLLKLLFEQPRGSPLRRRLCQCLTALAAQQDGEAVELALIFSDTALVLWAMGDYLKALEFYEKDKKISETVLGPEHPDTATTYNNLADVYRAMGDYPIALEYHEKTRRIREAVLGPEHRSTATTYHNLASVYQAMGDYPKALEFYEKARKIREAVLGPEHPDTATTYNNLAGVYQAMGDYPKALEFYERARKIVEAVLGPEHPDTATTYNNLALVYKTMGDYPKALESYEKARKIRETILGPEHPSTATTYNNMAGVYQAMGDYPKALESYDKARKIQEAVLGPEHPSTATTYNNLAEVYKAMGDYPKALESYEKARKIREAVLGPEHPSTAITYHNLAMLHIQSGNIEEALRLSDQAVAILRRVLGPDHPNTKTVEEANEFLRMISPQT